MRQFSDVESTHSILKRQVACCLFTLSMDERVTPESNGELFRRLMNSVAIVSFSHQPASAILTCDVVPAIGSDPNRSRNSPEGRRDPIC